MALITTHTHTHFAYRLSWKGGKLLFDVERDQTVLFFFPVFCVVPRRNAPCNHFKHYVWRVFKLWRSFLFFLTLLRIGEILYSGFLYICGLEHRKCTNCSTLLWKTHRVPMNDQKHPLTFGLYWKRQWVRPRPLPAGCNCANMVVLVIHLTINTKTTHTALDVSLLTVESSASFLNQCVWCFPFLFDHI